MTWTKGIDPKSGKPVDYDPGKDVQTYAHDWKGGSDVLKQLDELEDPHSDVGRRWDEEHDRHVVRQLLELIRPEFRPASWDAFTGVMLDGKKPADVANALGVSVNAVLLAKSRVLARLRQVGLGIIF